MTVQTTKPTEKHIPYKLFGGLKEESEASMAIDVFDVEGSPKVYVTISKATPKRSSHVTPYETEIKNFKGFPDLGIAEYSWFKEVQTVNIIPEILLGIVSLVIGLVGIFSQNISTVLPMMGFIIAGMTILIGSSALKKRIESNA